MRLSRALRIALTPGPSPEGKGGGECVAFVGAGGKTTAMFQLARELAEKSPVIVTAASHLGIWQIPLADRHIAADAPQGMGKVSPGITLFTGALDGERTRAVNSSTLSWLYQVAKNDGIPLLIEADGSRGRPLKAPAAHEPPIPDFAETVVVVAGLGGIGKPLSEEFVFRSERFREICGTGKDGTVSPEMLTAALLHLEGGLKNIPPTAKRIALLNQADTPELQAAAQRISRPLLEKYDSVVAARLKEGKPLAVYERIAGILLAAGESKRFGKPKQALDWKGKPFVRRAAETAIRAGLSPVVVVTGAHADQVEGALAGLGVKIVRNENWRGGQAGSVIAGIRSLPKSIGGCVFLLADQPHIGTEIIHALAEAHAQNLSPVVAPLVLEERRANPVLFDRVTFPDLLALTGDAGGRAIFGKHKVEYLPWHDEALLLDVDTPEDYERLAGRNSILPHDKA